MILINTILFLICLVVVVIGLLKLAHRNANRPVQKWAEKQERKPLKPVLHREIAFRATVHCNPLTKLR